ncbi:MAG: DUF2721 domain-containing protein [Acidobacteria bacterium]|nr:DUF2721 domain-containing protein [Acidobacteriota bacterium]
MSGDLLNVNPNALNSTIEFLTAMITPALLISATGSLVLSTSTRLGRVIDRVRILEDSLADLITTKDKSEVLLYSRRIEVIIDLLDKVTSRSRLLQRAMVVFYWGLAIFVLTSVSIGIVGIFGIYRWIPIPVGLIGILFLFYGSVLMMLEARMATATVNVEMDFTWSLAREVAPPEIMAKYPAGGMYGTTTGAAVSEIVAKRRTRKKS